MESHHTFSKKRVDRPCLSQKQETRNSVYPGISLSSSLCFSPLPLAFCPTPGVHEVLGVLQQSSGCFSNLLECRSWSKKSNRNSAQVVSSQSNNTQALKELLFYTFHSLVILFMENVLLFVFCYDISLLS